MTRKHPIINLDALPQPEHFVQGSRYESFDVSLSALVGAEKLGYGYTSVPPGKRSCPFHNHWQEEELFIILSGRGTYRFGADSHPVRAGDIIAAPTGGQDTAHHLINDGDEDLRYLSISTKAQAEIVEYPDSGKVGVFGWQADPTTGVRKRFRQMTRAADPQPDYFEGEE